MNHRVNLCAMHKWTLMKKARRERLIRELKMGERSGFLADFDKDAFLKDLHRKHASKG